MQRAWPWAMTIAPQRQQPLRQPSHHRLCYRRRRQLQCCPQARLQLPRPCCCRSAVQPAARGTRWRRRCPAALPRAQLQQGRHAATAGLAAGSAAPLAAALPGAESAPHRVHEPGTLGAFRAAGRAAAGTGRRPAGALAAARALAAQPGAGPASGSRVLWRTGQVCGAGSLAPACVRARAAISRGSGELTDRCSGEEGHHLLQPLQLAASQLAEASL